MDLSFCLLINVLWVSHLFCPILLHSSPVQTPMKDETVLLSNPFKEHWSNMQVLFNLIFVFLKTYWSNTPQEVKILKKIYCFQPIEAVVSLNYLCNIKTLKKYMLYVKNCFYKALPGKKNFDVLACLAFLYKEHHCKMLLLIAGSWNLYFYFGHNKGYMCSLDSQSIYLLCAFFTINILSGGLGKHYYLFLECFLYLAILYLEF